MRWIVLLGLLVAGCETADVSLTYSPTPSARTIPSGNPAISAVMAQDQRKEAPNRLGTIMGGYGNPIKYLNTRAPVKDEVAAVFTQALERRGLSRSGAKAPYRIILTVRRYDTDQIIGLGARAEIDMQVVDQSGCVVYQDTGKAARDQVKFFASGIFGSLEEMQQMAQRVLNEAVDQLIDKPAFRAAIQAGGATVS